MILGIYQYRTRRELTFSFALVKKMSDRVQRSRFDQIRRVIEASNFPSGMQFKTNSSGSRNNFSLEFIYE